MVSGKMGYRLSYCFAKITVSCQLSVVSYQFIAHYLINVRHDLTQCL